MHKCWGRGVEWLTAMAAFFSFTTLGSSHCVDRVSGGGGGGGGRGEVRDETGEVD